MKKSIIILLSTVLLFLSCTNAVDKEIEYRVTSTPAQNVEIIITNKKGNTETVTLNVNTPWVKEFTVSLFPDEDFKASVTARYPTGGGAEPDTTLTAEISVNGKIEDFDSAGPSTTPIATQVTQLYPDQFFSRVNGGEDEIIYYNFNNSCLINFIIMCNNI